MASRSGPRPTAPASANSPARRPTSSS
jgi:hypothetical protein